jgi:hypothetical protein
MDCILNNTPMTPHGRTCIAVSIAKSSVNIRSNVPSNYPITGRVYGAYAPAHGRLKHQMVADPSQLLSFSSIGWIDGPLPERHKHLTRWAETDINLYIRRYNWVHVFAGS